MGVQTLALMAFPDLISPDAASSTGRVPGLPATGEAIRIRPVRPSDLELERRFVYGLSARSRYLRLLSGRQLQPGELERWTNIDPSREIALVALVGAGAYSLWKERALLSANDLPLFLVGFGFSFVFAWLCVRWLLRYVSTHTFVPFAWYRIAFGVVVLATAWSGLVVWHG